MYSAAESIETLALPQVLLILRTPITAAQSFVDRALLICSGGVFCKTLLSLVLVKQRMRYPFSWLCMILVKNCQLDAQSMSLHPLALWENIVSSDH
jgi:hypothetical protein